MVAAIVTLLAMQPDPAVLRRLFEEGLARREHDYGMADRRTAQAARDLGMFLERQGDTRGARTVLAETVRIDESAFGPSAGETLADVAELAGLSPPGEAIPLWQRAAEAADGGTAVRALTALGSLESAAGHRDRAASFYRRALAGQEKLSGADSEPVAVWLNALAQVVEVKDGIPLLERAMAIDRRVLGPRHPQTATTEANLAGLLVNARRNEEAIRAAADALSIFQETLGADHPRCAIVASILAFALEETGQIPRAEKMYRLAMAIDEQAYGPQDPHTAADRQALAEFLKANKK